MLWIWMNCEVFFGLFFLNFIYLRHYKVKTFETQTDRYKSNKPTIFQSFVWNFQAIKFFFQLSLKKRTKKWSEREREMESWKRRIAIVFDCFLFLYAFILIKKYFTNNSMHNCSMILLNIVVGNKKCVFIQESCNNSHKIGKNNFSVALLQHCVVTCISITLHLQIHNLSNANKRITNLFMCSFCERYRTIHSFIGIAFVCLLF